MRAWPLVLLCAVLAAPADANAASQLVVWAWERPEDLRFLGTDAEVASQAGFVVLSGDGVFARGRRFPLLMQGKPGVSVVHVQIDRERPLGWTAAQRSRAAQAVLALGARGGARELQVDFEVRRSERPVLLELLSDVRRALPSGVTLSMTALASWCDTEDWLSQAPVDEVVPMLFRMGPQGSVIKARLARGGDFANPVCRAALAVSTDAPWPRAPDGRRVYLFSPRSWRAPAYAAIKKEVGQWSSPAAG